MQETDINLLESKLPGFQAEFASEVTAVSDFRGDLSVDVKPARIKEIALFLKNKLQFDVLMDLFAMDYLKFDPPTPERFAVIYSFYSTTRKKRVRVKVYLSEEKPEIESLHKVYAMVNWFEREAWDLFGITFQGHPHLERLLCHGDFEGHPLRKDYPSDQYQRLKTALPGAGL